MNWDILRDQIWDFIGVIIAAVTLFLTLIITYFQKHRKGITYEIVSKASLLTQQEKIKGKLKIVFEGQEVDDVKLVEIKVSNSGNISIPGQDYERPLKFIFADNSQILTTEVIKSIPENLTVEFEISGNEIVFDPILMNSKDSFIFKSIISRYGDAEIKVDARIKDVKEVRKSKDGSTFLRWSIVGMVIASGGLYQLATLTKGDPRPPDPWTFEKTVALVLLGLGYLIMAWAMLGNSRARKSLLRFLRS